MIPRAIPRRSLYRQFIGHLLVPIVIAVLIAAAGSVWLSLSTEQDRQTSYRKQVLDTFVQAMVKPLWDCDFATSQGIIDALSNLPVVAGVQLTDRCSGETLSAGSMTVSEKPEEGLICRKPVMYHDELKRSWQIGELKIRFHPVSTWVSTLYIMLRYLAWFTVLLAFLLLGAVMVFRRTISQPLNRFRAAIHIGIPSDGRAPRCLQEEMSKRNDELGDVMGAYSQLMREQSGMIRKLRENEQALTQVARRDPLTGLGNRLVLEDELNRAVLRAGRSGVSGGVLLIDLDYFKPINDTYGHAVGDIVLRTIAFRLQDSVRESDTVVRMGGDEFVIIAAGLRSPDALAQLARKIQQVIAEPIHHEDKVLHMSACVGTASFPADGVGCGALLVKADQAMYGQKNILGHGRTSEAVLDLNMNPMQQAQEAM